MTAKTEKTIGQLEHEAEEDMDRESAYDVINKNSGAPHYM